MIVILFIIIINTIAKHQTLDLVPPFSILLLSSVDPNRYSLWFSLSPAPRINTAVFGSCSIITPANTPKYLTPIIIYTVLRMECAVGLVSKTSRQ
jgi:hypothetical protein